MNILVTGGSSGLGKAIIDAVQMYYDERCVHNYDLAERQNVLTPNITYLDTVANFDKPDPEALTDWVAGIDILINCAGVNIINWLSETTEAVWDHVMDVNAKGIFKMSQACLPHLVARRGTIVNVISNAAHMPMTCSIAYNASKGAAHIMTMQMARELTRKYGLTVFGIAPNKLAGTAMSNSIDEQVVATRGWTLEEAQDYQLKGLLAGAETPPESVAEFLAFLLSNKDRHKFLTGTILPYGL